MNNKKIYRKYTFNRAFEIISGCVLIVFGLGSILNNPTDPLIQKFSFICGFTGIFLFIYGFFYKIEFTNEFLVFSCLIPCKRISLMNVVNLKIDEGGKNTCIIFEYSNEKKQKLSNIEDFKFSDCLIEDIKNVVSGKEQNDCNAKKLGQIKIHTKLLIMQICSILAIILSLIVAGIISCFFINLIKKNEVVENPMLIKICVIGFFSIIFLLFFELFLFFIKKMGKTVYEKNSKIS